ncbi:MAG TPA: ABC transporter permease [Streptosporangiaceae bacterium]|nr:ABC transporter permease [Streptosporangiaceae bacterium]
MIAAASQAGQLDQAASRLPSLPRQALVRGLVEIKLFFRQRESVVFTFALPMILLVLFGQIFNGTIGSTGVSFRQYFIAGIIASGLMSATFVNLGVSIAADRDDGTLTRLAGTPLSPVGYFAGKAILAFAVALGEVVALLALGVGLLGLQLPTSAGRWLTLAWVLVLGAATCSLLGIALSCLVRASTRSAVAVMNLPYLVLSFISGVYFVFSQLPTSLQRVAAIFPLKWICQGLRSAFLPDKLLVAEPAHSWEHGRIALVLGAWLVASLVICIWTFRWQGQDRR